MSFRRYIAATVREGLDRVRRELGEDAVILSNKRLGPGRIEIVAAASDSMDALVEEADRPNGTARQSGPNRERARSSANPNPESFQDYLRRQAPAPAARSTQAPAQEAPAQEMMPRAAPPRPRPAARVGAKAGLPSEARSAAESLPSGARSAEEGVAMYHEVAAVRAQHEEPVSEVLEPAPAPARPASQKRVATAAVQSEPAAPPAVFRQRPPRDEYTPVAEAIAGPASPATLKARNARATPTAPLDFGTERPAPPAPPAAPQPAELTHPAPAPRPQPAAATPQQPDPSRPAGRDDNAVLQELRSLRAALAPQVERDDARVMQELRSLRAALSDRITALESNIALSRPTGETHVPRNPAPTRVMTRLLMSGFSPDLARRVASHAPPTSDTATMDSWLHEVIAGNLRCAAAADGLLESQGAIALVGPTGVGKTTTVAKLAARFAVRYGTSQLGLVTLDSYRIGAHEQLRGYGRILGVPVHVAQDGATLRELLTSLQGKRLVLIDTCGLSQRDERMEEVLGTLAAARFAMQPIRRVLLLNAASHPETLDEVTRAWRGNEAAGAILTKMDEAARIGGAVDCLLRYRMTLFGLTNGQRVPEDWHPAGARLIAHVALKPSASPYALGEQETQALADQLQGS